MFLLVVPTVKYSHVSAGITLSFQKNVLNQTQKSLKPVLDLKEKSKK